MSTATQMPMGAAAKLPLTAADLMPPVAAPATGAPPQQAAGLVPGPGGTPLGGFPDPNAPAEPPYDVVLQADGSSIYTTKTEPKVVLGVNKPPPMPKALQPPQ